jgi:hypothetical protein
MEPTRRESPMETLASQYTSSRYTQKTARERNIWKERKIREDRESLKSEKGETLFVTDSTCSNMEYIPTFREKKIILKMCI